MLKVESSQKEEQLAFAVRSYQWETSKPKT